MRVRTRLAGALARATIAIGAGAFALVAADRPPTHPVPKLELVDGSLSVSDSRAGAAVLSAQNLKPGDTAAGTVTISNTGSLRGEFTLSTSGLVDEPGPRGGLLSTVLLANVEDVSGGGRPRAVYNGPLGSMPSRPLGTFEPGEQRTYEFTVTLPDVAIGINDVQGSSTAIAYRWDATAADADGGNPDPNPAGPPPAPPPPAPDSPLTLTLKGAKKWSARKKKGPAVTAVCGSACTLKAKVKVKGVKRVKLKVKTKPMASAADRSMKFTIVVPKKAAKALRKAVKKRRKRKKVSIAVTVTATDTRGQVIVKRHKIKVKK